MKKIIRLTESDLIRLVKRVINERSFANQSEVDRVLDKISAEGMDSLTPEEKEILQNPDKVMEKEPEYEEPDNENEKFDNLYKKVKETLSFIISDFPSRWEKVKNSPKKQIYIDKIVDLLENIGKGLDTLEDIGGDTYEVEECRKLFSEAKDLIHGLLNED